MTTLPTSEIATAPSEEHSVLIVDDSVIDRHLAGAIVNKMPGWKALFASNGAEALQMLRQGALPSLVLTDMLMPEMDGLELVQSIRARFPMLPVILMTAHGSEDSAIHALQGGAASYVPKKSLARELGDTMEQLLSLAQANTNKLRILENLVRQESNFLLENDVSQVPLLVNHLEQEIERMKLCEPAGMILLGVALHEALTNAIFHGNLELSSTTKENDEKLYYRLAAERRTQPPYQDRRVHVKTILTKEEATFTIRDEGPGFDPSVLPDPTDPSNLENVTGRGLLLIQTFMDRVEHNDKGNQITMVKRRG